MKKILVTGGAGYIGSITAKVLLDAGYRVIVIDDLRDSNRNSIPDGVPFFEANFADQKVLNTIFELGIDAVVHFAASANVPKSITNPEIYFQNNVSNGLVLLEAMRKHNCRDMVFSSSAAVYGDPQYLPIDENHPKIPINAYGESKLIFETMLYWYHRAHGFRVNSFRYFNAAGATPERGENRTFESHLLPLVIGAALGDREKVSVFGNDFDTPDGTCIRDYVHVLDIANAHLLALENLTRRPFAVYNLGSGCGYSVLEIIDMVKAVSGKKVLFEFDKPRPGDPARLVAKISLALNELKWQPEYSLANIIASDIDWLTKKKGN